MNTTLEHKTSVEQGTIPQAGKLLTQLWKIDRPTMQRLIVGMASDIAEADLTEVTRFDLCRFLRVEVPFQVRGKLDNREIEIDISNNLIPLPRLVKKVGGEGFGNVKEMLGPNKANFFITVHNSKYNLGWVRKELRAYDLKLASTREMAEYGIKTKAKVHESPYGCDFALCGTDVFGPPSFYHLVSFYCREGKLGDLVHSWDGEDEPRDLGEYWHHTRAYLVRRMTPEEIKKGINC